MSFFMADQKIIKGLNYPQGYPFGLNPNIQGMYDLPVDNILAFWNMSKTVDNKILEGINSYDAVVRDGINIDGIVGDALLFDEATEVDLGIIPIVYSEYTFSMWLKVFNMVSLGTLYHATGNANDDFSIIIDGGYLKCINYLNSSEYILSTTSTLSQDTWIHFLYTYGSGLKRIYLDNILQCEQAVAGHHLETINHHNLGYNGSTMSSHYLGIIDQLRMYKKVLASEERSRLYSERVI